MSFSVSCPCSSAWSPQEGKGVHRHPQPFIRHGGNPDERCAVSPVDPAEGRHSGLGPSHPDPGNGSYSWPDLGPCSSLEYLRAREHGVHPEPSVRAVVDEEWVPQRGRGSGRAKNAFPVGPGFRSLERLFLPCSPRPQIGLRHESSAPT